jgi:transcriptional regulator with PAS, ATPase and Fis domain
MIYLSFIGNHDKIEANSESFGSVITIFKKYIEAITEVYLFVTPDKKNGNVKYSKIAFDNQNILETLKPNLKVNLIKLDVSNPIDYDIIYPVMLDKMLELNTDSEFNNSEKIINISSGTPTMTACWLILNQSGIIKDSKLVQSFETKYIESQESNVKVVNLNIDDFPSIQAPSSLKRQLTIISRENKELSRRVFNQELDLKLPAILGTSEKIREIKEQILYDINSDTSVLIIGERGTGKQVIANSIWSLYRREGDDKLLTLDCGTLPKELIVSELFGYKKGSFTGADKDNSGMLMHAKNRMLFLDEIGNMLIESQNTLLRFLNDGEIRKLGSDEILKIETQVIAATNKNINDSTLFAQDLKDRFDEIITLPPLRERKNDIPILVNYFLEVYSKLDEKSNPIRISDDIMETLVNYNWPGNVRELEKWIKRLIRRFDGGCIDKKDLPDRYIVEFLKDEDLEIPTPSLPLKISLEEYIEIIRDKAREIASNNMSEVDRLLNQTAGTEKQRQYRKKKNNGIV